MNRSRCLFSDTLVRCRNTANFVDNERSKVDQDLFYLFIGETLVRREDKERITRYTVLIVYFCSCNCTAIILRNINKSIKSREIKTLLSSSSPVFYKRICAIFLKSNDPILQTILNFISCYIFF